MNELARSVVDQATGDVREEVPKRAANKNPAAVTLGRLVGLNGDRARAAKLTAAKRKEIAKKAAKVRWEKRGD